MTLHFELWQLALFFVAMGIGLAEIGDSAAFNGELDGVDNPRKRTAMYLGLFLGWWVIIPLAGILMGLGRWLDGNADYRKSRGRRDKKGDGPWD